jgi:hypothetical protein
LEVNLIKEGTLNPQGNQVSGKKCPGLPGKSGGTAGHEARPGYDNFYYVRDELLIY